MSPPTARTKISHSRESENRSRLIAGSPAIIAAASAVIFGLFLARQPSQTIASQYQSEATNALAAGQFETARICYERLLQSDPRNESCIEGLALSLRGMGQDQEAAQLRPSQRP
jgi:hypothetical protein